MEPLHIANWRSVPLTLTLIGLSCLGFLLVYLLPGLVGALTFTAFEIRDDQLRFVANGGQYWRLLTPIFLHFGWLHIAFNCLWMWQLGGKLEQQFGSLMLGLLVVVIGIGSNVCQFLWSGSVPFGGMSGVIYGLLGYCIVAQRLFPGFAIALPPPIIWFMLGWLLFGMLAPTQVLGFGSVANGAHLGGFIFGIVAALVARVASSSAPGKPRK